LFEKSAPVDGRGFFALLAKKFLVSIRQIDEGISTKSSTKKTGQILAETFQTASQV
jgi:hypothetical protein